MIKRMYCVINIDNSDAAEQVVSAFENNHFNVQIIRLGKDDKIIPHYLLNNIQLDMESSDYIAGLSKEVSDNPVLATRLLFMTDNPVFLKLVYRLYHEVFDAFLFLQTTNDPENYLLLDDVYDRLIAEPWQSCENLYKPIYSNSKTPPMGNIVLKDIESLDVGSADCLDIGSADCLDVGSADCSPMHPAGLYYMGGQYFLFNPAGDGLQVVPFGDVQPSEIEENPPSPENIVMYLEYDQEMLEKMTGHIRRIGLNRRYYTLHAETITADFQEWAEIIRVAAFFERRLYDIFMDILGDSSETLGKLYLLSFRLKIATASVEKSALIEALFNTALNSYLDASELYYIFFQGGYPLFSDASLRSQNTGMLSAALRDKVCAYYKNIFRHMAFIEKAERDERFVVVITSQMLVINHGPTKTALDRCYTLIKDIHKDVILICTKELGGSSGEIPFFMPNIANVVPEYEKLEAFAYKDIVIPFMQLSGAMPRPDGIRELMDFIRRTKPYFVVSIGSGIIPDIIDGVIPVITVGTVPSSIPNVNTTFKTLGRKLTDAERANMEKNNIPAESIIESVFTSAFREQTHSYTREELGLPSGRFLLLVVGGRLDQEVTEVFIRMFLRTLPANTHMVLLGRFTNYGQFCKTFPELSENSTYLGFMDDVLAVNEVCDLYVNPKRTGGGTSVAEALFKGLPAVTLSFGDVAVGTGPDFCVDSYDKMAETVIRYARDKDFYAEMSQKAKDRAAILTDTATNFSLVIEQAVHSPLFH